MSFVFRIGVGGVNLRYELWETGNGKHASLQFSINAYCVSENSYGILYGNSYFSLDASTLQKPEVPWDPVVCHCGV